eukprot:1263827-Amphidinium_carterae.1
MLCDINDSLNNVRFPSSCMCHAATAIHRSAYQHPAYAATLRCVNVRAHSRLWQKPSDRVLKALC